MALSAGRRAAISHFCRFPTLPRADVNNATELDYLGLFTDALDALPPGREGAADDDVSCVLDVLKSTVGKWLRLAEAEAAAPDAASARAPGFTADIKALSESHDCRDRFRICAFPGHSLALVVEAQHAVDATNGAAASQLLLHVIETRPTDYTAVTTFSAPPVPGIHGSVGESGGLAAFKTYSQLPSASFACPLDSFDLPVCTRLLSLRSGLHASSPFPVPKEDVREPTRLLDWLVPAITCSGTRLGADLPNGVPPINVTTTTRECAATRPGDRTRGGGCSTKYSRRSIHHAAIRMGLRLIARRLSPLRGDTAWKKISALVVMWLAECELNCEAAQLKLAAEPAALAKAKNRVQWCLQSVARKAERLDDALFIGALCNRTTAVAEELRTLDTVVATRHAARFTLPRLIGGIAASRSTFHLNESFAMWAQTKTAPPAASADELSSFEDAQLRDGDAFVCLRELLSWARAAFASGQTFRVRFALRTLEDAFLRVCWGGSLNGDSVPLCEPPPQLHEWWKTSADARQPAGIVEERECAAAATSVAASALAREIALACRAAATATAGRPHAPRAGQLTPPTAGECVEQHARTVLIVWTASLVAVAVAREPRGGVRPLAASWVPPLDAVDLDALSYCEQEELAVDACIRRHIADVKRDADALHRERSAAEAAAGGQPKTSGVARRLLDVLNLEDTLEFARLYSSPAHEDRLVREVEHEAARRSEYAANEERKQADAARFHRELSEAQARNDTCGLPSCAPSPTLHTDACKAASALINDLASKCTLAAAPQAAVYQPLPGSSFDQRRVMFFMHMPPELAYASDLGALARMIILAPLGAHFWRLSSNASGWEMTESVRLKWRDWFSRTKEMEKPFKAPSALPSVGLQLVITVDSRAPATTGVFPGPFNLRIAWCSPDNPQHLLTLHGNAAIGVYNRTAAAPGCPAVPLSLLAALPTGHSDDTSALRENTVLCLAGSVPVALRPWLSPKIFSSLGRIRVAGAAQVRHILAILSDPHMSSALKEPPVRAILQAALRQRGPAAARSPARCLWRSDLSDSTFVIQFKDALTLQLQELEGRSRHHAAILVLIDIAGWLGAVDSVADDVLRTAHRISERWFAENSRLLRAAEEARAGAVEYDRLRVLQARSSAYSILALTNLLPGVMTQADAAAIVFARGRLTAASALLWGSEAKALADELVPEVRRAMYGRAHVLRNFATMQVVQEGMWRVAEAVIPAERLRGTRSAWLAVRPVSTSNKVAAGCYEATLGDDNCTLVQINVLEGIVLLNGFPVGLLQKRIRDHSLFKRIFGDTRFGVVLTVDKLRWETERVCGRHYEFGHDEAGVLHIEEVIDGPNASRLRLVPHEEGARNLLGGLPFHLRGRLTAWLEPTSRALLFRAVHPMGASDADAARAPASPISFVAKFVSCLALAVYSLPLTPSYSSACDAVAAVDAAIHGVEQLLPSSDPNLQALMHSLGKFVSPEEIIALSLPGTLAVRRLRFVALSPERSFEVVDSAGEVLFVSAEYRDYALSLREQQMPGLLSGFTRYLVLDSLKPEITQRPRRLLLARDRFDASAVITWEFDPFGQLTGPTEEAQVALAYECLAVSTALPEPLSEKTGVERAMELVRQLWRNSPFSPHMIRCLVEVRELAMTSSQHGSRALACLVRYVYEASMKLAFMYPSEAAAATETVAALSNKLLRSCLGSSTEDFLVYLHDKVEANARCALHDDEERSLFCGAAITTTATFFIQKQWPALRSWGQISTRDDALLKADVALSKGWAPFSNDRGCLLLQTGESLLHDRDRLPDVFFSLYVRLQQLPATSAARRAALLDANFVAAEAAQLTLALRHETWNSAAIPVKLPHLTYAEHIDVLRAMSAALLLVAKHPSHFPVAPFHGTSPADRAISIVKCHSDDLVIADADAFAAVRCLAAGSVADDVLAFARRDWLMGELRRRGAIHATTGAPTLTLNDLLANDISHKLQTALGPLGPVDIPLGDPWSPACAVDYITARYKTVALANGLLTFLDVLRSRCADSPVNRVHVNPSTPTPPPSVAPHFGRQRPDQLPRPCQLLSSLAELRALQLQEALKQDDAKLKDCLYDSVSFVDNLRRELIDDIDRREELDRQGRPVDALSLHIAVGLCRLRAFESASLLGGASARPVGHAPPVVESHATSELGREFARELLASWQANLDTLNTAPTSAKERDPDFYASMHAALELRVSTCLIVVSRVLQAVPDTARGKATRISQAAHASAAPTILDAVRAFAAGDSTCMAGLNPFLGQEAVAEVTSAVQSLLVLHVLRDKLARLVGFATARQLSWGRNDATGVLVAEEGLLRELQSLRDLESLKRGEDPPSWLALEAQLGLTIRPLQRSIARAVTQNPGGLMQVNMGEGKSRVIVPMLCAQWADCSKVVRLNVLSAQLPEVHAYLQRVLGGILGRRVFLMPFDRRTALTTGSIAAIRETFRECLRCRGIMLVTPEHRQSLLLKWQELCHVEFMRGADGAPASRTSAGLSALLADAWAVPIIELLDESDELLRHLYQLVYTLGAPSPLSHGRERWLTVQALLRFLDTDPVLDAILSGRAGVAERMPRAVRPRGAFSAVRLVAEPTDDAMTSIQVRLADLLLADPPIELALLAEAFRLPADRAAARGFILNAALGDEEAHRALLAIVNAVSARFGVQGSGDMVARDAALMVEHVLYTARGLLSFRVLEHALRKRHRVEYGPHPKRADKWLAVPYRAKELAAERTDFGHEDIALTLTYLSFYYDGLSRAQVLRCFEVLLDSAQTGETERRDRYALWLELRGGPEAAFPGDTAACAEDRTALSTSSGINLERARHVDLLHAAFSHTAELVNYFLTTIVFPVEAVQFPNKLVSSAWDIAAFDPCAAVGTIAVHGFSGTDDNSRTLPLSVYQIRSDDRALAELQATNGKVADVLTRAVEGGPDNTSYHRIGNDAGAVLDAFVTLVCAGHALDAPPPPAVLIDAGALLTGVSNANVVRHVLARTGGAFVGGGIFFSDAGRLTLLYNSGREERLEVSGVRPADCFVYLDDAHTRGTDIPLGAHARAVVTVGKGMQKDKLAQAAMRMRGLGRGQTVCFVGPDEVTRKILALCGTGADATAAQPRVTSLQLLRWVLHNTVEAQIAAIPEWARQGASFLAKNAASKRLQEVASAGGRIEEKAGLTSLFVMSDCASPEDLYASTLSQQAASDVVRNCLKQSRANVSRALSACSADAQSAVLAALDARTPRILETAERFGQEHIIWSARLDEECERELELVKEHEIALELPPPSTPATETLWDAAVLLSDTFAAYAAAVAAATATAVPLDAVPAGGPQLFQLGDALALPEVWQRLEAARSRGGERPEVHFSRSLLATANFRRVLADGGRGVAGHAAEALRPLCGIVTLGGVCVALTSRETAQVLPLCWDAAYARGGARSPSARSMPSLLHSEEAVTTARSPSNIVELFFRPNVVPLPRVARLHTSAGGVPQEYPLTLSIITQMRLFMGECNYSELHTQLCEVLGLVCPVCDFRGVFQAPGTPRAADVEALRLWLIDRGFLGWRGTVQAAAAAAPAVVEAILAERLGARGGVTARLFSQVDPERLGELLATRMQGRVVSGADDAVAAAVMVLVDLRGQRRDFSHSDLERALRGTGCAAQARETTNVL